LGCVCTPPNLQENGEGIAINKKPNIKRNKMSMSVKKFTVIVVSSLVAGISVLCLPKPTLANPYETDNVDPLQDLQTVDNPDPFSNGGGLGMFDLLHRSRLGINRNMSEFSVEQRQSINDEAAQFRAKQQMLIDGQSTPGEESLTPEDNPTTP
jgi:hypothetical protein